LLVKKEMDIKSKLLEHVGRRILDSIMKRFPRLVSAELKISNDETIDHLETLYKTSSLTNEDLYKNLRNDLTKLGKEINCFIVALEKRHNTW